MLETSWLSKQSFCQQQTIQTNDRLTHLTMHTFNCDEWHHLLPHTLPDCASHQTDSQATSVYVRLVPVGVVVVNWMRPFIIRFASNIAFLCMCANACFHFSCRAIVSMCVCVSICAHFQVPVAVAIVIEWHSYYFETSIHTDIDTHRYWQTFGISEFAALWC